MGLEQLVLVLDAPEASYRSGDEISGRVIVGVDEEKALRRIYVKLKGESEVRWTESESRTDSDGKSETVWETYSAKEVHVDSSLTLLGGAGQELLLPKGSHVYHFRFPTPLSARIPPSFEDDHGHVRYCVKAKVDRPWRVNDKVVTPINVVTDVDLNLQPALREPATAVREKTLCCCWCTSGPLTLVVHTPSTGFVPGQGVSVTVEVDNATDSRVQSVVCKLSKKVQFKATRKVKNTHAKMASIEFGSVEPRKSGTWTRVLTLPQILPPSGLPHCSIILLSYCLSVKANVSGAHISPTVEIPVVVGTVPLTAAAAFPFAEPSAPPQPSEAPPPSYEESVYGTGGQPTGSMSHPDTKYHRFT